MGGNIRNLVTIFRYRFFLFAGLFPYILGQVIAFRKISFLNWYNFWLGFLGIVLVLFGVELFNEYFDAKEGGDRIFLQEKPNIPGYFLLLALGSMLFAFFIGIYLTFQVGWPVLLFSMLGFLGAYFYVGPPIRWAYRGLGELVIALCYGPFMVLGSYYLQTKRIEVLAVFISLISGLLIFALALINEMPDYYQDKLIGKNNLVVRFGRKNSTKLFGGTLLLVFLLLGLGVGLKLFPLSVGASFFGLPLVLRSIKIAQRYYDSVLLFVPAIRLTLLTYIVIIVFLGINLIQPK